jgi:hypothetical protein
MNINEIGNIKLKKLTFSLQFSLQITRIDRLAALVVNLAVESNFTPPQGNDLTRCWSKWNLLF